MSGLLVAACVALSLTQDVSAVRPNIVLIVVDDLGYGELGCYGGREIPTPEIDSLAKGGVRFTSGYVTAPFCAASRAAMLTGRYQTRFGFEFNPIGAQNADPAIGLPVGEKLLPERLRDSGYATALIGKWHLGGTAKFHPQRRGFDEFFGFLHEGHYYVPPPWKDHVTWLRRKALPDGSHGRWSYPGHNVIWSTHLNQHEPDYDADNPLLRNSQPVDEHLNLTDAFTREAIAFIDRHQQQPFFLCLAYNAVHSPMQAHHLYLEKFKHIEDEHRRIFAAMLAHLDDNVGHLLSMLDAWKLNQNTIVIFISDNGGPTRELTSSNHPLRGEKGQLFEGGVRVPFLMRWPARLPAGHVEHRAVSSLDIAATVMAAAGIVPTKNLDGVDLVPRLVPTDTAAIHDRLYWRVGQQAALRQGEWKIHRSRTDRDWQLFHLTEDIAESRDQAAIHPETRTALEAAWKALDEQMVAPLWGSPSPSPKVP